MSTFGRCSDCMASALATDASDRAGFDSRISTPFQVVELRENLCLRRAKVNVVGSVSCAAPMSIMIRRGIAGMHAWISPPQAFEFDTPKAHPLSLPQFSYAV